jgi:predicted RNA-binding protein (TIGR00451 family)
MIKQIIDFVKMLGSNILLDKNLIVTKENKYFLVNEDLKRLTSGDFFHAGVYVGKIRNGRFVPSFSLLDKIAEKKANKIFVDKKSEWLFICGRDIFRRGIVKAIGSKKKGGHVLVMNQHSECLGLGRIVVNLDEKKQGMAIENVLDIGDFLRRERT